jgi:glycosyltransferase involved in cell wall biosynthesis
MKPKLLVLASTFPGTPGDGTPAFVLDLALQQAKDFDVTVITPMVPGAARAQQMTSIDGGTTIQVVRYRYFLKRWEDLAHGAILDNLKARKSRLIQVPFLMLGLWCAIKAQVAAGAPAAIHAHWVIPQGVIATLAAPSVPLLVTTHGGDIYALNAGPILRLKKWVFNRAAAITTVNSQMKSRLVEFGLPETKVSVLPMGVDTATVGAIAANATKKPRQLLVVGRLVEKKGIEYLFEALAALRKRGIDVGQTIVIGDGPIRPQLEDLATTLPVTFLGQRGRAEVLQAIAESEIMLIPSVTAANGDQEGLPVTLLEGGAGQICVIASNLPGIDEVIVTGQSGILVPQRDSSALADALEQALADPALRSKLALGIANSVKRFDIATIGAGYNAVLNGMLGRNTKLNKNANAAAKKAKN